MHIVYIWIEQCGCFRNNEFNFTSKYDFHYDNRNGKLDFKTARIVSPVESFRKETVQWLHDNYGYVEHSILTESQRQKVKNGIVF